MDDQPSSEQNIFSPHLMLKPMFSLFGMDSYVITMAIPLKYFKSGLNLRDANEQLINFISNAMSTRVADNDGPLDIRALNLDGYSGIFALGNLNSCDFNLLVVPHNHPWINIFPKESESGTTD